MDDTIEDGSKPLLIVPDRFYRRIKPDVLPSDDTRGVSPWGYDPDSCERYESPYGIIPPLPHPLRKADTDVTYVRDQLVAETRRSSYSSDQEMYAAVIPPPWMIDQFERLRREQDQRRPGLRIPVHEYTPDIPRQNDNNDDRGVVIIKMDGNQMQYNPLEQRL